MIKIKGVLMIKATTDGGVGIYVPPIEGAEPRSVPDVELTGAEWQKVIDLVRQEGKMAALKQQADEYSGGEDGIQWNP